MGQKESIDEAKTILSELEKSVLGLTTENKSMMALWGWNYPPIDRHDLAGMPKNLYASIEAMNFTSVDENLEGIFDDIVDKITNLKINVIPHLFTGNANTLSAVGVYIQTFNVIYSILGPYIGWGDIPKKEAMPKALLRKLNGLSSRIDSIAPNMETLEEQVKSINEASEAADTLPTDLAELKKARDEVNSLLKEATIIDEKIKDLLATSGTNTEQIKQHELGAQEIVKKCDTAYSATTTHGLAGAFDSRARELKDSLWLWVLGLIGALVAGFMVGSDSITKLSTLSPGESVGAIVMNIILALLSVGGSIWFAWLSTKQIGQRFKLAEDYAFKAAVAKAYEGYKKEAVRIDPLLEARLFASALTRLEEAPLRLVEDDQTHGSPWHELFASEGLKKALENVPEFKRDFIDWLKGGKQKVEDTVKDVIIAKVEEA